MERPLTDPLFRCYCLYPSPPKHYPSPLNATYHSRLPSATGRSSRRLLHPARRQKPKDSLTKTVVDTQRPPIAGFFNCRRVGEHTVVEELFDSFGVFCERNVRTREQRKADCVLVSGFAWFGSDRRLSPLEQSRTFPTPKSVKRR